MEEGDTCRAVLEKREFDSFDSYYDYLNGDIYCEACYYGYSFSDDEIGRYKIDIEKLNFKSFIYDDIRDYTFELVQGHRNFEDELKISEADRVNKWILSKIPTIFSYDDLIKKLKSSVFPLLYDYAKFFSLLIQRDPIVLKDIIVKYAYEHCCSFVRMDDILFYYGPEAGQIVIDNFNTTAFSKATIQKRLKRAKQTLALFCENNYRIVKKGKFDFDSQLFCVSYEYYNEDMQYPFMTVNRYSVSLEGFAKELDGDLRGCDLSKSHLTDADLAPYKTDETTLIPIEKTYKSYSVSKIVNSKFSVIQKWYDANHTVVLEDKKEFSFFCDFVYYLKGDLSDADFLMCESISNKKAFDGLNISGIKVRSNIAKQLGFKLNLIAPQKNELIEFEESKTNEIATSSQFGVQRSDDDDFPDKVAYVSDIHLLHRYDICKCETIEDRQFVVRTIVDNIGNSLPKTKIKLVGGDVASNFEEYQRFISELSPYANNVDASDFFFTLGNHELWSFPGADLASIESRYCDLLSKNNMHLVHNNLYYYDYESFRFPFKEITAEELQQIGENELREKMRTARLIIFGGIGFSGQNQVFNADNGIYRGVLTRAQEIEESRKFELLYEKVARALFDKNVIIFTHMPMKDWSKTGENAKTFVYVSGHNHKNYFHDDGIIRIYADNQIGYKQRNVQMKSISLNMDYDWFSDYQDGIHEITREDYMDFYRGIRKGDLTFSRDFEHLYMIKREGVYMFLMMNKEGNLRILNGGSIKNADVFNHTCKRRR